MKIKSYYSRTVEDAIASARQEMGPDAMLVNSRKAPLEARHLGEYEVVFANLADAGTPGEASLQLPGERSDAFPPASAPMGDRLSVEVAELKKELEGMRRAITRTAYAPSQWVGVSQDVSDAYAALTAAEVSPELAREIVQAAGDRCNGHRPAVGPDVPEARWLGLPAGARRGTSSRFTADATLGRGPATRASSPWSDLPVRAKRPPW